MEVSEQRLYTLDDFRRAEEEWVGLGFYVALDDFGTKGSNFDLVFAAKPDYMKFDRVLIDGVSRKWNMQRLLAGLVEAFAGKGVYPIIEGLEKEEDLEWLVQKGWDVGVQGFVLARPSGLTAYVERR